MFSKLRDLWLKRRRTWLLPVVTRDYQLMRAEQCRQGEAPHEYEGYVDQYGTHWECIWCRHEPEAGRAA